MVAQERAVHGRARSHPDLTHDAAFASHGGRRPGRQAMLPGLDTSAKPALNAPAPTMNSPFLQRRCDRLSRRAFLGAAARATAVATATAAFPLVSRGRVIGANDRIGVGFIGVGGRGSSHIATVAA